MKHIPSGQVFQAKNIQIGYRKGKNHIVVAEDISFNLENGKLTCLLGPNGVGKSTLLQAIMGRSKVLGGELLFQGRNIESYSLKNLAKKIAVVLTDKVSFGQLTIIQLVALGRIPYTSWTGNLSNEDESKVKWAIEATNLTYLQNKRLSELSDGQLQKAMIARALAQDGEVIILDEPTAHLDLANRYEIMQLLKSIANNENKMVLVVTHDLDIAIETADQFWIMSFGMPLITGCPEDLIMDGRINSLFPEQNLTFNSQIGKVQEFHEVENLTVDGPLQMVQWLNLALRKNKIKLDPNRFSIQLRLEPLSYHLIDGNSEIKFDSIESLLKAIIEKV